MKKAILYITAALLTLGLSFTAHANKTKKKMDYKEAKKECLKEKPTLSDKALKKCIKKKRK